MVSNVSSFNIYDADYSNSFVTLDVSGNSRTSISSHQQRETQTMSKVPMKAIYQTNI